jgi:hypothetical protein
VHDVLTAVTIYLSIYLFLPRSLCIIEQTSKINSNRVRALFLNDEGGREGGRTEKKEEKTREREESERERGNPGGLRGKGRKFNFSQQLGRRSIYRDYLI